MNGRRFDTRAQAVQRAELEGARSSSSRRNPAPDRAPDVIQLPLYLSADVVKLRGRPRSDTLTRMQPWWLVAGGVLLVAIMIGLFRPRQPRGHDLGVISDQWLAQHRVSARDTDR
jgi:hypothetical protein